MSRATLDSASLTSTIATSAPSSAKTVANARPIPVAAPVITATRSCSRPRLEPDSAIPTPLQSQLARLPVSFEDGLERAPRRDRVTDHLDLVAALSDQPRE